MPHPGLLHPEPDLRKRHPNTQRQAGSVSVGVSWWSLYLMLEFFPLPPEDIPSFCIPASCPTSGNSLAVQWLGLFPTRVGGTSKRGFLKRKVPPRLELGSLDSESRVLTITPWNHNQSAGSLFQCEPGGAQHRGPRTRLPPVPLVTRPESLPPQRQGAPDSPARGRLFRFVHCGKS